MTAASTTPTPTIFDDAADQIIQAIYEYRALRTQADLFGLPAPARRRLARLDRDLAQTRDPTKVVHRQFRRIAVDVDAEILAGHTPIAARTANLSAGGANLAYVAALPARSQVTLRVRRLCEYRFPARVVRFARAAGGGWELALAFTGVPLQLRRRASYGR